MRMEDLVLQNPWWKKSGWEKEDRYLKQLEGARYTYDRKDYLPDKKGVIIIYGPRQVGKTTWIKQRISELLGGKPSAKVFYINSETVKDRFELYEVIKMVFGLYNPNYVFIDEISSIADWEKTLKIIVDAGLAEDKHIVLIGSSSVNIMKKTERLPGRMASGQYKFRYYPLSFGEVARLYGVKANNPKDALGYLNELNRLLYSYFLHGGFIKAINYLSENSALDENIFSVYSAWIDGELAKVKRSPEIATYIMDGIANSLTNDISWSSLARTISHPTVADYVEILKNMFVVDYIEKSKRARVGIPKNKKIYFIDPFLFWLSLFKSRKITSVTLADIDEKTAGMLAELSAYENMKQYIDLKTRENDFDSRRYIYFEKERSGETDFVVNFGKDVSRLECKFGKLKKEKEGEIYLTKDEFDYNKIPLSIFLMFPEDSIRLLRRQHS
jgi:predicted AAA+ superfamily ATPase